MDLIHSSILFALILFWCSKSGDCDDCKSTKTHLDNYCMIEAICFSEKYEAQSYDDCYNKISKYIVTFENICRNNRYDTIIELQGQSYDVKQINVINSDCNEIPQLRNAERVEEINLHGNKISIIDRNAVGNRYLIKLNVSINNIQHIYNSPFSSLECLEILDLSSNKLEELQDSSLSGLDKLKLLKLSNNRLTKIENVFSNLPKLEEIYLDFNEITDIKKQYFKDLDNLKILSLSNNNIKEVNNAFSSLTTLQEINLNFNQLSHIEKYDFSNLENIKVLSLSNNRITEIDGAFFTLTQLEQINLGFNQLTDINKDSFINLENLKVLLLNSNTITNIEWSFLNLTPSLVKFDISYNSLRTLDKKSFTNNVLLEYVDISDNSLTKLYPNTFLNKNLSFFSIKDNLLQGRLERGMFEGMKPIIELDLSYQHIETVADYAFKGLNNLVKLLLNNNKICALQKHAFDSLLALEILDLSNNIIHNVDYEKKDLIKLRDFNVKNNLIDHLGETFFLETVSLRCLDVSHNNITRLEKHTFAYLHELINLDLSSNAIAGSLEAGMFEGLESIPSLDLSYTSIDIIMNKSFIGLLQLSILNISHSDVHEMQYNAFCELNELESMDLSYNKLTVLNLNFSCIQNLKFLLLKDNFLTRLGPMLLQNLIELDISFNELIIIEDNTFDKLEALSELVLSNNNNLTFNFNLIKHLKKVSSLSLAGLALQGTNSKNENQEMIKKLDLSNCNIINVTDYMLETFLNCDELNLSGNKIPYVWYGMISKNTKLRIINLSFNGISYLQPGSFKDNNEIEVLNVAHNKLFQLEYGTFKGLWRLNHLDISFNKIRILNRGVFDESLMLATLIADNNDIKTIQYNDFSEVPTLKILSIGSNPISCLIFKVFDKFNERISLTALVPEYHISNHNGVTCKSDSNNIISNGDNSEILFNNNTFERQEQLLEDIKDLVKIVAPKQNSMNNINDNSNVSKNLITFAQNIQSYFNKTDNMNDKLLAKINDDTKMITESLYKMIRNFNFTLARLQFNHDGLPGENKTSDNMLNYLLQDLNDKIDNFDKRITEIEKDKTRSAETVQLSKSDVLENSPLINEKPVKLEVQASVFQNVCLGFIAIVILCLVLQKIYKSDFFVPVRRSLSTRRINEHMEADNL